MVAQPSSGRCNSLQSIVRTGIHIKQLTQSDYTSPPTNTAFEIPSLSLPSPTSISSDLTTLGVEPHIAEKLSNKYKENALELRERVEASFRRACLDMAQLPRHDDLTPLPQLLKRLIASYRNMYSRGIDSWAEKATSLAHARASTNRLAPISNAANTRVRRSDKGPRFNQEYLPLLEHFFTENQKPSRADKEFLAKKSNMTFRQIEVWFQNQRRRRKSDGTIFRRKPGHEPPSLPFDTLIARMPDRIVPQHERVDAPDSDDSEYEDHYFSGEDDETIFAPKYRREPQVQDVLDPPAPGHAFPTIYPPACKVDPFPKDNILKFPSPVWMRKPASTVIERRAVDFEKFLTEFSGLTVMGPIKERRKRKRQDPRKHVPPKYTSPPAPKPDRQAATIFITTRLPRAPHPAFIPSQRVPPTLPVCRLPAVRARASQRHVFWTPSPQTKLATLVPPASAATEKSSRKVAPLPRRTPRGNDTVYRNISEASAPSPSSQSSPPNSRVSSYNSDVSSYTQVSSDSSPSSSAVVTPITPPQPLPEHLSIPHISLPGQLPPPTLAMPGFTFTESSLFMSELFGNTPSPVGEEPTNLSCGNTDQFMPFNFPFEGQRVAQVTS